MELYYCNPHIVSKGKQAIVKEFANTIKDEWEKCKKWWGKPKKTPYIKSFKRNPSKSFFLINQ